MAQRSDEGPLVGVSKSIGENMPKACNLFEVTHSTWSSLYSSLGHLWSVGMLATLIKMLSWLS
jgi:hypothetical protein